MCPYRYAPACSPHLAARMAGDEIQIDEILAAAGKLAASGAALIVEGAGGVFVPLSRRQSMIDLMTRLALPVVLVARGTLGTINHTLLSLQALRAAELNVLGVVLCDCRPTDRDFVREDNPRAIAEHGAVEILGEIPYLPDLAAPSVSPTAWDEFEKHLPHLPAILERLA